MLPRPLIAAILIAVCASVALAASEHLKFGARIMLHVASPVSSKTAHIGDRVLLVVEQDVLVNDYVVVAHGAKGRGVVSAAERARASVPGQLRIRYEWVLAVDNVTKVPVDGGFMGSGSQASDQAGNPLRNAQLPAPTNRGAGSLAQTISRSLNVFRHSQIAGNGGEAQLLPGMHLEVSVRDPKGVPLLSNRRASPPR